MTPDCYLHVWNSDGICADCGLSRWASAPVPSLNDYQWTAPEDEHHGRARILLDKWVDELGMVGMMSLNRDYLKKLTIDHLENKLAAEVLVDLLAAEFRKESNVGNSDNSDNLNAIKAFHDAYRNKLYRKTWGYEVDDAFEASEKALHGE